MSNSLLYLLQYLIRRGERLTVDEDYVKYFITEELASLAFSETYIQEIEKLVRDEEAVIDIATTAIIVRQVPLVEESIPLDSAAGLALLDGWHDRWQRLIRGLVGAGHQVTTDLSGGKDSRVTLSLFIDPAIDMADVKVNSATDGLHTHADDLEIATEIARRYGFELNGRPRHVAPAWRISEALGLHMSLLAKMMQHNQLYFPRSFGEAPRFRFDGQGGETIRSYWLDKSPVGFIQGRLKRSNYSRIDVNKPIENTLTRSFAQAYQHFGLDDGCGVVGPFFYGNTRGRIHYCHARVESALGNTISLAPCYDPCLRALRVGSESCADRDLLFALIYQRYLPEIADLEFDSGRKLDPATKAFAAALDKKYPRAVPDDSGPTPGDPVTGSLGTARPDRSDAPADPRRFLRDEFVSPDTQSFMRAYFGWAAEEIYARALSNWVRISWWGDSMSLTLVSLKWLIRMLNGGSDQGLRPISGVVEGRGFAEATLARVARWINLRKYFKWRLLRVLTLGLARGVSRHYRDVRDGLLDS